MPTLKNDTKIEVLIVDDDALAVQTLSLYFSKTKDFEVVSTAQSGPEALKILSEQNVDVILADIHMPGMNGLALQEEIIKHIGNPPTFLAITSIDHDEYVLRTLKHGGSGYILKSQRPNSIIQAVRDAVYGGVVVSPNSSILKNLTWDENNNIYNMNSIYKNFYKELNLSPSEKSIIELLCQGMSNTEISHRLHYSESYIKKQVSRLIRDFGATSRLDLVVKILNPNCKKNNT
ncbi:response regulator transcription factor [Microbacterium foliorum]|uniref:response regulator transcription factor n=1 Tax=Rothia terrae TaxID=396015 RepID=UPI00341AF9EF